MAETLDLGKALLSVYERAPIGAALLSAEGRFLQTNPALRAFLGYSDAELRSLSYEEVTHPADRMPCHSLYEDLAAGRRDYFTLEKRYLCKDGRVVWAQVIVNAMREAGAMTHAVGLAVDITARKDAEAALRVFAAEMEEQVLKRTEELSRSNRELELFAFSASHDLKAPLRRVLAFAALLAEHAGDKLDPQDLQLLDRLQGCARDMSRLVDDILALAQTGASEPSPQEVDWGAAAAAALEDLSETVRETRAEVGVGPLPRTLGSPVLIERLFQNLLANALKFRKEGQAPRVELSSSAVEGGVEVRVRDEGVGFEAAFAEEIFEAFRRLHPSHIYPGSGIGLAICRRIVEGMGGRIRAKGEPGRGATFSVWLPESLLAAKGEKPAP